MGNYQRLKDLREDKELTQQQIADLLFMQREVYRRYETGKREIPFDIVIKLADFYNVSLDYIAGRTNDKRGIGYADSYKTKIEQHDNEISIVGDNSNVTINKGEK